MFCLVNDSTRFTPHATAWTASGYQGTSTSKEKESDVYICQALFRNMETEAPKTFPRCVLLPRNCAVPYKFRAPSPLWLRFTMLGASNCQELQRISVTTKRSMSSKSQSRRMQRQNDPTVRRSRKSTEDNDLDVVIANGSEPRN